MSAIRIALALLQSDAALTALVGHAIFPLVAPPEMPRRT